MPNGRIDDIVDLTAIDAQFKKVFLLMDTLVAKINELNRAGINLTGRSGSNSNNDTTRAIQATDQLEQARRRLAQAESELGQQIAVYNERTRQQNVANAQSARLIIHQSGSLNDLRAQLARATREWDNMSAAERRMSSRGGEAVSTIQRLQREVRELELLTGRAQRNVGNYPQLMNGVASVAGEFGVIGGIAAIGATAKAIYDTTLQLDSLNMALRAVSGSEEEFTRNQAFLVQLSERLGLNVLSLTQAYKLFYAASTQSGLSADQTRKIFTSVAEASSTLKLSAEDTQGVLLAFSQILGKGKVQAEELRGQIGERIPGAFAIAAKSIGVTEQELNKMLEKGELIAKDFLPRFAAELEKTYSAGKGNVDGLQASVNRLSNTFTELVSDNQSGLAKFFTTIVDLGTSALKVINGLTQAGVYLFNVFSDPAKNKAFTDESALFDLRKNIGNLSVDELLKQRDLTFQNVEAAKENLETQKRLYAFLEQESKKSYSNINESQFKEQKKDLQAAEQALKTYSAYWKIVTDELSKRFPGDDQSSKTKPLTEAEIKAASRLRELQLKAALDANKIDLQAAIDSQLEIINSDKFSQYERLQALDTYNSLRRTLLEKSADEEKRILKENVLQKQEVEERGNVIERKLWTDQLVVARDGQKLYAQIIKSGDDKELAELVAAGEQKRSELEAQSIQELRNAKELHDNLTISDGQYNDLKTQIQNKYQVLALQSEAEYIEQIIALHKLRGDVTLADEQKLRDIANKIAKLGIEDFSKAEDEKTKELQKQQRLRERYEKDYARRTTELYQALANTVISIFQGQFERQKNEIDDQIASIEKRRAADEEAINSSTASEQERADRIAVINQQALTQTEQLNERKKQIELQQARFDKAKSAASIVQNTASAIIKAFADFPYPLALPLSIIIGATGAAELATVLATPLPRYRTGRKGGKAEWAITGDGGVNEVVESKYGTFVTPAKDTLTYLPEGATVYKNIDEYNKHAPVPKRLPQYDHISISGYQINNNGEIVKAIERNKQTVNVYNSWDGVKVNMINASGQLTYLNNNVAT